MDESIKMPASKETLENAIIEADLILAYASSRGIHLDDHIVTTVVQAKQLFDADLLDKETMHQQIAFWKVRSALALAVRPISAESLKLCTLRKSECSWFSQLAHKFLGRTQRMSTELEKTIRILQFRILVPIVLLLLLKVSVVIGGLFVSYLKSIVDLEGGKAVASSIASDNVNSTIIANGANEPKTGNRAVVANIALHAGLLAKWNKGWNWSTSAFEFIASKPDKAMAAPVERL